MFGCCIWWLHMTHLLYIYICMYNECVEHFRCQSWCGLNSICMMHAAGRGGWVPHDRVIAPVPWALVTVGRLPSDLPDLRHCFFLCISGLALQWVLQQVGLVAFCGCFLVHDHRVLTGQILRRLQSLLVFAFGLAVVYNFSLLVSISDSSWTTSFSKGTHCDSCWATGSCSGCHSSIVGHIASGFLFQRSYASTCGVGLTPCRLGRLTMMFVYLNL